MVEIVKCKNCNGSGGVESGGRSMRCTKCRGRGKVKLRPPPPLPPKPTPEPPQSPPPPPPTPKPEPDPESEQKIITYADMTVPELRLQCHERGLSPKGKKTALIKRLTANDQVIMALNEEAEELDEDEDEDDEEEPNEEKLDELDELQHEKLDEAEIVNSDDLTEQLP